MFHKYGNFEGCISGANTVSSNRSFSYAIFKRRIHDALTTRFVFKNSFIFFLFILLLLFYIYQEQKQYIIINTVLPMFFFLLFFIIYIYFFFFLSICHGSKHLFLLRIEAHDLIDSSALLTFFPRVRSIRRFYKVVSFDLRKAPSTDSLLFSLTQIVVTRSLPFPFT